MTGTVYSSVSGGGTSIITLPLYLSMGLALPATLTIQKFSGIFMAAVSAYNYLRGGRVDWAFLWRFVLVGSLGTLISVHWLVRLDESLLKPFIGVAMLCVVGLMLRYPQLGRVTRQSPARSTAGWMAYPLAFVHGLYEGVVGSGNAILTSLTLNWNRGVQLTTALGQYYAAAFVWVTLALVTLIGYGFARWDLMIPGALGATLGGYVGSSLGRRGGSPLVRKLMILAGGAMALRLLLS